MVEKRAMRTYGVVNSTAELDSKVSKLFFFGGEHARRMRDMKFPRENVSFCQYLHVHEPKVSFLRRYDAPDNRIC